MANPPKGTPAREVARENPPALKKGQYYGRGGKILTRERPTSYNLFDFPESVKEEGWSYQWCRTATLNNSDGDHNEIPLMTRAGWEPVKPDQLNGYFLNENKGRDCIVRDGLMLMERPQEMTDDARREAKGAADAAFQRGLGHISDDMYSLPTGFVYDRNAVQVNRDRYEAAPDDLKPGYARVAAPSDD
jgi:hypothetical protein